MVHRHILQYGHHQPKHVGLQEKTRVASCETGIFNTCSISEVMPTIFHQVLGQYAHLPAIGRRMNALRFYAKVKDLEKR